MEGCGKRERVRVDVDLASGAPEWSTALLWEGEGEGGKVGI